MADRDLREILEHNDLIGDILSYHTGGLTKNKIDTALEANGYLPPYPNKATFHLFKMNGTTPTDVWLITWFPMMDKFGVEKLSLKG